jgi:hypothetical protein
MPYIRCATGKCQFRTPDGNGDDALQPPRRKKNAPADVPKEELKAHQLVYDVIQPDPTKKCAGDCRCYIVVQITDTKSGGVVSETHYSADGDDENGLNKQEHDRIVKHTEKTGHRAVTFLAECLEVELNKETGKKEPKHKK